MPAPSAPVIGPLMHLGGLLLGRGHAAEHSEAVIPLDGPEIGLRGLCCYQSFAAIGLTQAPGIRPDHGPAARSERWVCGSPMLLSASTGQFSGRLRGAVCANGVDFGPLDATATAIGDLVLGESGQEASG